MENTQSRLETVQYYQYKDRGISTPVRVIGLKSNTPLFAAQDICPIIGLTRGSTATKGLDLSDMVSVMLNGRKRVMLTTKGVLALTATKSITRKQKETLGREWDLKLFAFRVWFKETAIPGYESNLPRIKNSSVSERLDNHTITPRPMMEYAHQEDYKRYITYWC